MFASDKTGLSDPYSIMSFGRYSTKSRVVKESLCPTWDQTMVISQIRVFGDTQSILDSPPPVVLEFYDKDQVVRTVLYMYMQCHECRLINLFTVMHLFC